MNQPRKRLDLTIAYWAAWWKQAGQPDNAYLYIHTSPGGVCDLKQSAKYCGIKGRLYGTDGGQILTDHEMPSLYNSFDVMISTCEGGSFELPVLEGMDVGVPQIAINCGGLPSWAGDAVKWVEPSFYAFTPNTTNTKRGIASEKDFVKAMQEMYTDANERQKYRLRGFEKAEQFKWDDVGDHFHAVLQKVLNVKRIAARASIDALSEF
jgi:glycosyltransferase involved in cell wall biosynthesis